MADKVTLESLDARMDKSDARLDRIEADLGTVKGDVGTLKDDVGTLKSDVGTLKSEVVKLTVAVERLERDVADVVEHLQDFNLQQKSMTSAVMEAVTQLHLSRTYEKRLDRLEAAVFGKAD